MTDITIPLLNSAIVHALCEEDRKRVDALTAATNKLAQVVERAALLTTPLCEGEYRRAPDGRVLRVGLIRGDLGPNGIAHMLDPGDGDGVMVDLIAARAWPTCEAPTITPHSRQTSEDRSTEAPSPSGS